MRHERYIQVNVGSLENGIDTPLEEAGTAL